MYIISTNQANNSSLHWVKKKEERRQIQKTRSSPKPTKKAAKRTYAGKRDGRHTTIQPPELVPSCNFFLFERWHQVATLYLQILCRERENERKIEIKQIDGGD